MSTKQEHVLVSRIYSRRSKVNSIKRAKMYEQWLQEYLPFANDMYEHVVNNVKGIHPDFDTFCRYLYMSCKCNFDIECLYDTKSL